MAVQRGLCEWYAPASLWTSERLKRRRRAQQICRSCPLLDTCRDWAITEFVLTPGERFVVGGLLDHQIIRLRHQRGIPNPATPRMEAIAKAKPKLLPVMNVDEKVRRTEISRAHGRGHHDQRPRDDCPRCAAASE